MIRVLKVFSIHYAGNTQRDGLKRWSGRDGLISGLLWANRIGLFIAGKKYRNAKKCNTW